MKKLIMLMLVGTMVGTLLTGCGNSSEAEVQTSETVEETVETVEVAEVVEEVESTPSVEEVIDEVVEDVAGEVAEEVAEESETDIAVETDLPVAGIGSDKIPFEGKSDDVFGVIYSLEEVPTMVWNFVENCSIEANKELKTEETDNGDGTFTYTFSGTITVDGYNIQETGSGYAVAAFDANTGNEITDNTVFDESLSATRVDTFEFSYSVTTEGKSDVVYAFSAYDHSGFPAGDNLHYSEYGLPFMFCK